MSTIKSLTAYPILDSRGQTTIEVNLSLDNGETSVASIPSGTSKGKYEARSVETDVAIYEVNQKISTMVMGKDFPTQMDIDEVLKSGDFGANSRLSVSIAFAKAAKTLPKSTKKVLPKLMMLAVEGGKHGHGNIQIQEFLLMVDSVNEGVGFYKDIGQRLEKTGAGSDVGLEGGYSPHNLKDMDVLSLINESVQNKIKIGLDVAAAHFSTGEEIDYRMLCKSYPLGSIEDPYSEDEEDKWQKLTTDLGSKIFIVGDDLTVTNPKRLKIAIEQKLCNAIIIKPNQIGTISETLEVVQMAKKSNIKIIVSHRSGETNDTFIADLAVAIDADYVKFGAPVRGERVAKYNRLLELEKQWK